MEGQQTIIMPVRKPLRTSNETIFPSLHPLGPLYNKKSLLQKRPSDGLNSETLCFEPAKKLHITPQDKPYQPVRAPTLSQKCGRESKENNPKPKQTQNKPPAGFDYGLSQIWEQILRANFVENFQTNLMMEVIREQMELTQQKIQQKSSSAREQSFSLDVKPSDKSSVSDSPSTTGEETEEETSPKENQDDQIKNEQKPDRKPSLMMASLHQTRCNDSNVIQQDLRIEEASVEDTDKFEIPIVSIQAVEDDVMEQEENYMPGFDDQIKSPVLVNLSVQAVIPSFSALRENEVTKKTPKLVWNPEGSKIEEVNQLMSKLTEILGFNVTNEEKVWRLLKKYDFALERCLEIVGRQKNKYKFEFKSKKTSHKKHR